MCKSQHWQMTSLRIWRIASKQFCNKQQPSTAVSMKWTTHNLNTVLKNTINTHNLSVCQTPCTVLQCQRSDAFIATLVLSCTDSENNEFKSENQKFSLTHSHITSLFENSFTFLNTSAVTKTTVLQILVSEDFVYSIRTLFWQYEHATDGWMHVPFVHCNRICITCYSNVL